MDDYSNNKCLKMYYYIKKEENGYEDLLFWVQWERPTYQVSIYKSLSKTVKLNLLITNQKRKNVKLKC